MALSDPSTFISWSSYHRIIGNIEVLREKLDYWALGFETDFQTHWKSSSKIHMETHTFDPGDRNNLSSSVYTEKRFWSDFVITIIDITLKFIQLVWTLNYWNLDVLSIWTDYNKARKTINSTYDTQLFERIRSISWWRVKRCICSCITIVKSVKIIIHEGDHVQTPVKQNLLDRNFLNQCS